MEFKDEVLKLHTMLWTQSAEEWMNKLKNSSITKDVKAAWNAKADEQIVRTLGGAYKGYNYNYRGLQRHAWYLNDFGPGSLQLRLTYDMLCFEYKRKMTFFYELLKEPEYAILIEKGLQAKSPMVTIFIDGNFKFSGSNEHYYDNLAWYAGNKTDEYVAYIAAKINRFRDDEELTDIWRRLNIKLAEIKPVEPGIIIRRENWFEDGKKI